MANNSYIDASEVLGNLNRILNGMESAITTAVENACMSVEADAKRNVTGAFTEPTGMLKRSITHVVEKENGNIAGYVGSNLFYAPYLHQGTGIYALNGLGRKNVPWRYKDSKGEWHTTSGVRPTPFLQDAVDSNRQQILMHFKEVLNDANSQNNN